MPNLSSSAPANSPSAEAFFSLPATIQEALFTQKRIICIANNPSITTQTLDALLKPSDLLVLFNHFVHADYFSQHPVAKSLPKLIFFRQIGDSKLHFGMPPRRNHLPMLEVMNDSAPLALLFANIPYQFPTPSDDPRAKDDPITPTRRLQISQTLKAKIRCQHQSGVLPESHSVVGDYPSFDHIHSSAPTSGFLLYRLLLAARDYIQEQNQSPPTLIMLGFNDEDKTGYFWEGHNWAFERQELAEPPVGVEVITQY